MAKEHPFSNSAFMAFPFFMLVVTFFVRGALFLFINGPVIYISLGNARIYTGLADFTSNGIIDFWRQHYSTIIKDSDIWSILLICMIIGLIIGPFEKGLTISTTYIYKLLKRDKRHYYDYNFYSSNLYFDYVDKVSKYPAKKALWEWETMFLYIYWGIFFNVFLFGINTFFVVRMSFIEILLVLATLYLFFFMAVSRSVILGTLIENHVRLFGISNSRRHPFLNFP